MAITTDTLDVVESKGITAFRTRFPSRDLGTDSFLGMSARALAMMVYNLLAAVVACDNDACPGTKTSPTALNNWAYAIGLQSNAGGYGRNVATVATGGAGNVTGTQGTFVATGTQLTASDGVTIIALSGDTTIPVGGSIAANFIAVTAGTVGNLPVGSVLTWISPPAGLNATVALTSPLAGAVDVEADAALLQRLWTRLQAPPKGGAEPDYYNWAEAVTGVFNAYEYPQRSGLGSVDVVVVAAGSGTGRKPSAGVQALVQTALATARPVASQGTTAWLPYMPAADALTIRARVVPASSRFTFDWIDTAASYTVAGWNVGTLALTLNATAPASLQSAIALGTHPRLQVLSTGASAVNPQVTVASIDGTNLILTLDALPIGWTAPTVGDVVYAGGPVVATAATAILAYVDSLGPSRVGGYADTVVPWQDTVEVAQLIRICLDAEASDGTQMLSNILWSGTQALVTIAVGAGAAATADVQGSDDPVHGPELLYCAHVAVTQ